MDPLLKDYLDGTLKSPEKPELGKSLDFINDLDIPIAVGVLAPDGSAFPLQKVVPPSQTGQFSGQPTNWYFLAWALDGSLAAVRLPTSVDNNKAQIKIGPADLSSPGDIGPVPSPSAEIPIPNDSPSILVGTGQAADSQGTTTYLTRAQFWKLSSDSITLAPNEEVSTGYTSMTGIQETSSETDTVAASVGASLSAGWGPVSASLSASFNRSTTTFQQYVSTQRDTRYESRTYKGDAAGTTMIFRWQLYDVVTISSSADNKILAQVTTAQHPDIVKIYKETELPAITRSELSDAARRELNELLAATHASGDPQWP